MFEQFVGVFGVGVVAEGADADVDGFAEEHFDSAVGGAKPGFVGIKEQDDSIAAFAERADMTGGQRGAERAQRIVEPGLMACDDVGVALGDDGGAGTANGGGGLEEAVERGTFIEESGFGAVEVFGIVLFLKAPAAEGDDATDLIVDREDQAISQDVVDAGVLFACLHEAAGDEELLAQAGGTGFEGEGIPPVGRGAEVEAFDHIGMDAAFGDDVPGLAADLGVRQDAAIERRREGVGIDHGASVDGVCAIGGGVAAGAVGGECDARAFGEVFEGFAGVHLVELAHEGEDIAAGAADEAMEDLFGRDDAHGGVVVVVEGAEADVFAAFGPEADVFADNADDVTGVANAIPI